MHLEVEHKVLPMGTVVNKETNTLASAPTLGVAATHCCMRFAVVMAYVEASTSTQAMRCAYTRSRSSFLAALGG